MTEKELMLSQQLYIANDPKLAADNKKATWLKTVCGTKLLSPLPKKL